MKSEIIKGKISHTTSRNKKRIERKYLKIKGNILNVVFILHKVEMFFNFQPGIIAV